MCCLGSAAVSREQKHKYQNECTNALSEAKRLAKHQHPLDATLEQAGHAGTAPGSSNESGGVAGVARVWRGGLASRKAAQLAAGEGRESSERTEGKGKKAGRDGGTEEGSDRAVETG